MAERVTEVISIACSH